MLILSRSRRDIRGYVCGVPVIDQNMQLRLFSHELLCSLSDAAKVAKVQLEEEDIGLLGRSLDVLDCCETFVLGTSGDVNSSIFSYQNLKRVFVGRIRTRKHH